MSRYLEIGTEIAQRVRSGELTAGIELPAVRESARAQGTTPSTIGRAYRYLADGGVITLTDRRRARVASDGTIAAARLLEADRVFRLAGSDDPALQIVLDHVGPAVIPVGTRGSFHGLRALARGAADGAAIHLRHRDGTYNAPFARALLRHRQPHLLHLWKREQGLLVPPGNPQGVSTPGDLGALRVAKREVGAGTRVLLDQLLLAAGICPEDVAGPETPFPPRDRSRRGRRHRRCGPGRRSARCRTSCGCTNATWPVSMPFFHTAGKRSAHCPSQGRLHY